MSAQYPGVYMHSAGSLRQLSEFLHSYGWNFTIKSEAIYSGWMGKNTHFPLEISPSEAFIRFEVKPFFRFKPEWQSSYYSIDHVLNEMNDASRLIKLTLQNGDHITVVADVMTEWLTFEVFSNVVGIIGFYCDIFHEELLNKLRMHDVGVH